MVEFEPAYTYPQLTRSDGVIPALFDWEIKSYHRGFVAGMFGSQTIKTGNGKSDGTCVICHEYDPDFGPDNIVFTPAEILRELSKPRHKGNMIMVDETQNIASNRTWFDLNNKTVMHTVATMRFRQQGAIFVTPMARMIDKDVQKLMRFAMTSWLSKEPPGVIAGWVRIREVATYHDDKDIAHRMIKFYDPDTGKVIELDCCKVFLPDEPWLKECRQKIKEYKEQHQLSLLEESEQFEEAEKQLYRKAGIFKPKDLAAKMLEEKSVINELAEKGKIQQGTIAAFYPGLKNNKDLGAVKWWVEDNWRKLSMGKKDGKPAA